MYAFGEMLQIQAHSTLERYGVRWKSCAVGHRTWRFDRRELDQLPIALVVWVSREGTENNHQLDSWKAVCTELRHFMATIPDTISVNIEIADTETAVASASFPLFPNDP